MEQSSIAFASGLPDGRLLQVNRAFCELTGYTEAELRSLSWAVDLTPPQWREREARSVEALQRTGRSQVYEKEYRRKDGTILPVEIRLEQVSDETGRPVFNYAFVLDISDRKGAQAAAMERLAQLQHARGLLTTITNAVPVLISYVSPGGIYQLCNKAYSEWFGISRDEIVGHHMSEVLGAEAWRTLSVRFEAAARGEDQEFEALAPYSRGPARWIHAIYSPHRDETGRVLGVVVMVSDVTGRRAAEEALRRSEERWRFLGELDDALRPLVDPQEITLRAASILGRSLNVDRCAYAEVEADEDTMHLTGNYTRTPEIKSIVGRLRFSDFGAEVLSLMRAGRPYIVNDVDTHQPPVGDLAAYRATQIQAVICVPLHKAGRFVAAMAVHSVTPREWDEGDAWMLGAVANRCWESIERGRTIRDIAVSEARKAAILESSLDCIITMDAEGRVVEFNPAAEQTFGYSRQEAVGRLVAELIVPARLREAHLAGLRRFVDTDGSEPRVVGRRVEMPALRKDGSEFPIELAITAIRLGAPSRELFFTAYLRDISARKQAEDALKNANEELDRFVGIASHDLKEPLRGVSMLSELLKEEPGLSEQAKARLDRIKLLCGKLIGMVDSLLEYARSGAVLQTQMCDLGQVAQSALEKIQDRVDAEGARVVILGPLPVVHGDPALLERAFANLIVNAIKHNRSTSKLVEIGFDGEAVYFRDNGSGIDPRHHERIFELFRRVNPQGSEATSGAGLGLALVRSIVRSHGGTVTVQSAPGQGSTFRIRMPWETTRP